MPRYLNVTNDALLVAASLGDGYSINLKWATAYPINRTYKIAYNIYMSSGIAPDFPSDFFLMPPTFLSFDGTTNVDIIDLIPGFMFHFAVRAIEYDPNIFNPSLLPQAFNGLAVYPQSLLASDIDSTDTVIPLVDAEQFPASGTVRIGSELVYYGSISGNNLIVPSGMVFGSHLFDFGGNTFYQPSITNVGTGIINNLQLVSGLAKPETWTIKCIGFSNDGYFISPTPTPPDQPLPEEAIFEAIGSVSGSIPLQEPALWPVYNKVVSNGILSFSISETSTFSLGDIFTIKVVGGSVVGGGRGYNNTTATLHDIDGYDGYVFWNPNVVYWPIDIEEPNTRVFECWNRFDIGHFPFTIADGYRQKTKDILTTDLTFSDIVNTGFPAFDFAGYHRTDPVMLLRGDCIGSYIGGFMFCADGYNGVGRQLRGLPIQDSNLQRQEVLLSTTGEPVCLVKRRWTGTTCKCMLPYNEYPEARCTSCLGTGITVGYEQFFNPRRSDGRIMVRFDPTVDDLIATDSGLESTLQPNCWGLAVPTIKERDFIVRFDEDGNEEFRYEVLNVTRNKLLLDQTGVEKFVAQRVRKTDILYQVKVFRDTSMFPSVIYTSIESSLGIPPHSHQLEISEKITSISQINKLTCVAAGHNHIIENGSVIETLGHSHTILLP